MSGFRFPLQQDPTPPLAIPATPLQELSNTFPNDDKENASEVSFKPKASTASNADPVTPDMFKKPLRVVQAPPPQPAVDDLPTFADLMTWKNPPASLFAFVGGECFLFFVQWCVGRGNITFTSGLCNVLLSFLALNFARGCFSERWLLDARWSGSSFERVLVERMQDGITFATMLRDDWVCDLDPWNMFKSIFAHELRTFRVIAQSAAALLLGNLVGAYISVWKLAMLLWAGLFIVPITRKHFGLKLHRLYQLAINKAQEPIKRLRLSRVTKLAVVSAVLGIIMLLASWTVRSSLLLLFLILVRCNLKNNEMKYFREHQVTKAVRDNIIVRSAFKAQAHVSSFADDVLASAMKSARWCVADRSRTRDE